MPPRADGEAAAAAAAKARRRARKEKWFNDIRGHLMTVSICLIGLAINGVANPPGGRYTDDNYQGPDGNNLTHPHIYGVSIMATEHQRTFMWYASSCTGVFLLSSLLIMIVATGLPLDKNFFIVIFVLLIIAAMVLIAVVFGFYVEYYVPKGVRVMYYWFCPVIGVVSLFFIREFIKKVWDGEDGQAS